MSFRSGIAVVLLVLLPFLAIAQKPEIRTVEGESQVEFPDTKSRAEVEKEALQKAEIDALERAFGTMVIRGNSTYMKNLNTGQETKTSTSFNSIANTLVKGEVTQVLDTKYEEVAGVVTIDGRKKTVKELKCTATFKVKELGEDAPDFEASPLQCPNPQCSTTTFKNEGSIYLYFKSPYDGYLAVYLDNGTTSQCLFPYPVMPDTYANGVPMKGGKEYILFKDKLEKYFGESSRANEYELSTEGDQELDRLFIIFSRSPIAKPDLKSGLDDNLLTPSEKARRYSVPKSLLSEDFQKWMIKNRTHRNDLKVMTIDITIQK